jgi:predicted RNA-binding Zn-ribbon protein involved in translation (DUF1610 family)
LHSWAIDGQKSFAFNIVRPPRNFCWTTHQNLIATGLTLPYNLTHLQCSSIAFTEDGLAMSIIVTCSTCGAHLKVADSSLGKKVLCPKCDAEITIVGTKEAPNPATRVVRQKQQVAILERDEDEFQSPPARRMKECDFCGEQVLATAKKCKHCGETLDPALRAADEAKRLAKAAGRGSGSAAAANTTVIVQGGGQQPFPHLLHLIITLCTCGLWLPVWITLYLIRALS